MDTYHLINDEWPDNMSEAQFIAEVDKLKERKRKQDRYNDSLPYPRNLKAHGITEPAFKTMFKSLQEKYENEKINPNRRTEENALLNEKLQQALRDMDFTEDDFPQF